MSLLRLGPAAEYIGVHPVTLRLVATFAGRMYGLRSREAKRRLLAAAGKAVG